MIIKVRLIFGFLIASIGASLVSMDVGDINQQLLNAIATGKLEEARRLLYEDRRFSPDTLELALWHAGMERDRALCELLMEKGANSAAFNFQISNSWPLRVAVEASDLNMVQFLIEQGVDLYLVTDNYLSTVLMLARDCKTVQAILTTMSPLDRIAVLQAKEAAILAHNLAFTKGIRIPQRDLRKIITNEFVDALVDQQMERIVDLLNIENISGYVAYVDPGLIDDDPECLNPYNPVTRANLRRILAANIRKILFP